MAKSFRSPHPIVLPPRLRPGDLVALVNPAGATYETMTLDIVRERLEALGFRVRLGRHVLDRRGYFAGRDEDRAADLMTQFSDPEVAGIVCVRGGWGSARLLPLLDFRTIAANPKVFLGFSDITALLNAVHARTGLVTFHGPVGASVWNRFSVETFRSLVMEGRTPTLSNPETEEDDLAPTRHRIRTIRPGRARGRLAGGNLTVLTSMVGSGFLPDWEGRILFLEDIREEIYRVDRMLTQLRLAGVLEAIEGFVFGHCTECEPGRGFGSLTLEEVFDDHVAPLGIPAWSGSMVGHIPSQFTLPLGVEAEIDATAGTILLLEPAVE